MESSGTSKSRFQCFHVCSSQELMECTTEDHFGIKQTMNCTCLSLREIRAKRFQEFGLKAVLFGEPGELNFLEVDVSAAERIECLVDSFLCGENHGEALVEIAMADPVEFSVATDQMTDIRSLHPFLAFQIHADRKTMRPLDYNRGAPWKTVGDRAYDSITPQRLSAPATEYGSSLL